MDKDLLSCIKWIANSVVVDYFESGIIPSVTDLRTNWQSVGYEELTDLELKDIIDRVSKFYK